MPKKQIENDSEGNVTPPVIVNGQSLPYKDLRWDDFERLCCRLAEEQDQIVESRPYGRPGDKQHGIDIYAVDANGKYTTYQCKKVKSFTALDIEDAFELFIKGSWYERSETFVICTAHDLSGKLQSDAIEANREKFKTAKKSVRIWDAAKLNIILKKHPQLVYDFFGKEWFSSFIGNDRLSEVIIPRPIPDKQQYAAPDSYLHRTVRKLDNDVFRGMWADPVDLLDVLKRDKRIALLAWGQDGKSTELQQLAHLLSAEDSGFYPFLATLKSHDQTPIANLFPNFADTPKDQAVILLDGLDEVLNKDIKKVSKLIMEFADAYPRTLMVVSCRTNFYVTNSDEQGMESLGSFHSYSLDHLISEVVETYVVDKLGYRAKNFWQEANAADISSYLVKPYYLVRLVKQFQKNNRFNTEKADLFREELEALLRLDIRRMGLKEPKPTEKKAYELLQQVAFVMTAAAKAKLTSLEMNQIITDVDDRKLLSDCGAIITLGDAETGWTFTSQGTQEYLASTLLAKQPVRTIRKTVSSTANSKKVGKHWANTLLFLGSMQLENGKKIKLFEWLKKHNIELLIQLQVQDMEETKRLEIFRQVLDYHDKQGIRLMHDRFKPADMAGFSQGKLALTFLLQRLEKQQDESSLFNILEIIPHYHFYKFPQVRAPYAQVLEKLMEAEERFPSLQWLVLTAYNNLQKHSNEDCDRIFNRFSASTDTNIRSSLFYFLVEQKQHERHLKFILDQALLLVCEDNDFRSRQNRPIRLGNEFRELNRAIAAVRTKDGLLTILSFMAEDHRLNQFVYSTYFKKSVLAVLEKMVQFAGDQELNAIVAEIFRLNHSYIIQYDLADLFLRYFEKAEITGTVFMEIYKQAGEHLTGFSSALSLLTGAEELKFLASELESGRISGQEISTFDYYFQKHRHHLLADFRALFKIPEQAVTTANDMEIITRQRQARALAALFDKDQFTSEIKLIFDSMNTDEISTEHVNNYELGYYEEKFLGVARDFIDIHARIKVKIDQLLQYLDQVWDMGFIERIYEWLLRNPEAQLKQEQIAVINEWCNQKVQTVDFRNAVQLDDYRCWTIDQDSIYLSYFLRKFGFNTYHHELYLDMLSVSRYQDTLEGMFEYAGGIVDSQRIIERALQNLQDGINYPPVLENHLTFVSDNHLDVAVSHLLNYMKNDELGNRAEILKIYLSLGGAIEPLIEILPEVKEYFSDTLIATLVSTSPTLVKPYLISQFLVESDQKKKLRLAKYLIPLNHLPALKFYKQSIESSGIAPDTSSPTNPLYRIGTPRAALTILKMVLLSEKPIIKYDRMSDLFSISISTLRNLASKPGNYLAVAFQYHIFIIWTRVKNVFVTEKASVELLRSLREQWEFIRHTQDHQDEQGLDLNAAIALYESAKR